jgi:UDP:flavonoid glycosyltransferase YjiC (YdhE family)
MRNYARSLGAPSLYGYSPSVIPKPPDWDEYQHVTGYWFLDAQPDWQPPADLLRFLESGSPPVYVGFGSVSHEHPERQTRLILRALELTGQRGVLLTGWGGLTRLSASPNVFFVDNVPHAWLFPRMAAVIHHGGAGTTGAGLRAGVPNIITAFVTDQGAWADRVVQLGVGPRVPGIKQLTAEKLAEAINTAVNDSALRARAAALGEKIRAENGVARAVELIERHAADFRL